MAAPYRYVIGPVIEQTLGGLTYYAPPEGCVSWIDLRRMGDQSALGQIGCGFFTMPSGWEIPSGYHWLGGGEGDCRSLYLTGQDQSAWASLIGVTPTRTASTMVVDALDETLTDLADPSGENAPKPLVPSALSGPPAKATIILGGHSSVRKKLVPAAGRWWNNLISLHKRDIQAIVDRGDNDDKLWRKYLGSMAKKYFGRWDDERGNAMVPDRAKKERKQSRGNGNASERRWALRPETTYTDDFTRSDATGLGASWSATVSSGSGTSSFDIVSNRCRNSYDLDTSGYTYVRYESDVSSSDHYAEGTVTADSGGSSGSYKHGVSCRNSASADTCYAYLRARGSSTSQLLLKIVAGAGTVLSAPTYTTTLPVVLRCSADGSTIDGAYDGNSGASVTDTAIASGTRGGIFANISTAANLGEWDDWSIADLAAAGSPWNYYAQQA